MLRDDVTTLAEQFAAAGYATGSFTGAVVLDAQLGIAQGFDHFELFSSSQHECYVQLLNQVYCPPAGLIVAEL